MPKQVKLTACESAFVEHLKKVCVEADRLNCRSKGLSDETILATWHEAFEDWLVAVKWGQVYHKDISLRGKRKPNFRLKPVFLHTLESRLALQEEAEISIMLKEVEANGM